MIWILVQPCSHLWQGTGLKICSIRFLSGVEVSGLAVTGKKTDELMYVNKWKKRLFCYSDYMGNLLHDVDWDIRSKLTNF